MTDGLAMGEALQADAMKHHAEMGVNNKYWRPKMLKAFEDAWNEVIAEESAKDLSSKKSLMIFQHFVQIMQSGTNGHICHVLEQNV